MQNTKKKGLNRGWSNFWDPFSKSVLFGQHRMCPKFLDQALLTHPASRYWAILRWSISNFQISGQFLVNENCDNSRTNDIDMKLGSGTKFDKRNTATLKQFGDVMLANCDIIALFPIYG